MVKIGTYNKVILLLLHLLVGGRGGGVINPPNPKCYQGLGNLVLTFWYKGSYHPPVCILCFPTPFASYQKINKWGQDSLQTKPISQCLEYDVLGAS